MMPGSPRECVGEDAWSSARTFNCNTNNIRNANTNSTNAKGNTNFNTVYVPCEDCFVRIFHLKQLPDV